MSKNINLLNFAYGLCISDFIFRSCNKLLSSNFFFKIFPTFDAVAVIGLFLALGALIFNGYFKNKMFIPVGILIASAAIVAFGPMYLLKFVQLFGYVLLYLGLALIWLLFLVQAFFGSTSEQKLKYLLILSSFGVPVLTYVFRAPIMNQVFKHARSERANYIQNTYHVAEQKMSVSQRLEYQKSEFYQKNNEQHEQATDLIGLAASLAICLLLLCSVLVKDPLIATGFILLLQPFAFLSPALLSQGFKVLGYDSLNLMLVFISLAVLFYGVRRWNNQKQGNVS